MGRTNSYVKSGGTPTGNCWDDLTGFPNYAIRGDIQVDDTNTYYFTAPPKVTSFGFGLFGSGIAPSTCRKCNIVFKNTGDPITSLYAVFPYSAVSHRTFTFDFDTSTVTNWNGLFTRAGTALSPMRVTINGTLDFSAATNVGGMFNTWAFNENYQSSFRLAQESLHISWNLEGCCPDDDTLQSIIDGLADMTGETAPTLTMNANVTARLTNEQIAEATAKNWTIA